MIHGFFKSLLPEAPRPMRIRRGPFRGARIVVSPRASLRKVLGLYEHELNGWLESALRRTTRVLDVGANDGYFAFGCAAAFARLGKTGEIIAFEPQEESMKELRDSIRLSPQRGVRIEVIQSFVGKETKAGMTMLDALPIQDRRDTLIKIDVEGAELDVIEGAGTWLNEHNAFVIEVHREQFLGEIVDIFAKKGLNLARVDQQPLPLLGRELRDVNNWWLVSRW